MIRLFLAFLTLFAVSSTAAYECLRCCNRECGPFVVLAVEARHLDYSSGSRLIKTMSKHPQGGRKNSDVGHAWIYLSSGEGAGEVGEVICGGHSAETGLLQPRYVEGVCLLAEKGDPNPARYLFEEQADGHFQRGSGGHTPTFAAKIPITFEQFESIKLFLQSYPWKNYALSQRSCATLVAEVAELIGYPLEHRQTIFLEPSLQVGGERLELWRDSGYSSLTLSSPDVLEKSLRELVDGGYALNATRWLQKKEAEPFGVRLRRTLDDLSRLPERTGRALLLRLF